MLISRFAAAALALLPAAGMAAPEVFTIRTLQAQMRYDVEEITVTPGADVKIIFENADDMPHNMVFFTPGTDVVEASNRQMERPEEALKRNWLPEDPRVWLHSKMLLPKERDEIVFKAPEKGGVYPFVCTFPGHAVSMQGKLRVLPSGGTFTDLRYQLYLGDWKKLPDFATLTPHREGTIPEGKVQLKFDDYKNQYGVVFTGTLDAPVAGEHTFAMAGDDGVRLFVNGKKELEYDGIHPADDLREKKVKLTAGAHKVRLEYFQAAGEAEVYLGWRGPAFRATALSTWLHPAWNGALVAKKKDPKTGLPIVVGTEPVIYRNFIAGAGNRSIAVGYPGGFNLAWSAERMAPALLWRGAFMDAARHWIDRGGGHQPPLGFDVVRPAGEDWAPFAVPASPEAEWPGMKAGRSEGFRWRGYYLDAARFPTFQYEWNGVQVSERYSVQGDAMGGTGRVVRTMRLVGSVPPGAMLLAASGTRITAEPAGGFSVDAGKLAIDGRDGENRFMVFAEGARISGQRLVVPAGAEMRVEYGWPTVHAAHVQPAVR